jgi:hypothetical protein
MSITTENLPLLQKKSYHAATVFKKKLPRRCRDGLQNKYFEFHCYACIRPENIASSLSHSFSLTLFYLQTLKSYQIHAVFQCLRKNAAAAAMIFKKKPVATAPLPR